MFAGRYFEDLAAAFVRGKLSIFDDRSPRELMELGLAQGLRLHKFKRNATLPRVRKVLGILRGLAPQSLLDVGSGRGVFLWPLLDAFPELEVRAIDRARRRFEDLGAVARGGCTRLFPSQMDAHRLAFADRSADVVTLLEVLEHLPEPGKALAEAARVARRFCIVSAPSKEDDNPEHIHLFTRKSLHALLRQAGFAKATFDAVPNHIIAVAQVGSPR